MKEDQQIIINRKDLEELEEEIKDLRQFKNSNSLTLYLKFRYSYNNHTFHIEDKEIYLSDVKNLPSDLKSELDRYLSLIEQVQRDIDTKINEYRKVNEKLLNVKVAPKLKWYERIFR